ncbi:hypothetical protein [Candidatus Neptunichlamydia sp. REUL1]|nr:hypothetical protein [Candidatus Neptunochlamydia sp. REUL1]
MKKILECISKPIFEVVWVYIGEREGWEVVKKYVKNQEVTEE